MEVGDRGGGGNHQDLPSEQIRTSPKTVVFSIIFFHFHMLPLDSVKTAVSTTKWLGKLWVKRTTTFLNFCSHIKPARVSAEMSNIITVR